MRFTTYSTNVQPLKTLIIFIPLCKFNTISYVLSVWGQLMLNFLLSLTSRYNFLYTSGFDVQCGHIKINLPRDRESYDGFEYTDEKFWSRRIHWCGVQFLIFFFGELFLKIDGKCPNFFTTHSWMRLFESSNTEVSRASEVPQSRGKFIF